MNIKGCQWANIKNHLDPFPSRVSNFLLCQPTEEELLDAIFNDRFFGFLKCSIRCPDDMKEQISQTTNFPYVFGAMTVTEDMLSDYGKSVLPSKKVLPTVYKTLSFDAEEILLPGS